MLVLIAEEDETLRGPLVAAALAQGDRVLTVGDVREAERALAHPGIECVMGDLLVISLAALICPQARRILVTDPDQLLSEAEQRQFGIESVVLRARR